MRLKKNYYSYSVWTMFFGKHRTLAFQRTISDLCSSISFWVIQKRVKYYIFLQKVMTTKIKITRKLRHLLAFGLNPCIAPLISLYSHRLLRPSSGGENMATVGLRPSSSSSKYCSRQYTIWKYFLNANNQILIKGTLIMLCLKAAQILLG